MTTHEFTRSLLSTIPRYVHITLTLCRYLAAAVPRPISNNCLSSNISIFGGFVFTLDDGKLTHFDDTAEQLASWRLAVDNRIQRNRLCWMLLSNGLTSLGWNVIAFLDHIRVLNSDNTAVKGGSPRTPRRHSVPTRFNLKPSLNLARADQLGLPHEDKIALLHQLPS